MKKSKIGDNLVMLCLILIVTAMLSSCEKYLEEKPVKTQATPSTLKDLQALLDANPMNVSIYPTGPDIASDDFYLTDQLYQALSNDFKENYIWGDKALQLSFDWRFMYDKIFTANVVLENIGKVRETGDYQADRNAIEGAAFFYRAFAFYNLLQVFTLPYDSKKARDTKGLPIRLNADIESPVYRANLEESYQRIVKDLEKAIFLLPKDPIYKTRPSKQAAYAQLARTYLVMGNFERAYVYADSCLRIHDDLLDYRTISKTANNPFPQFNKEVIFHASTSGRGSVMAPSRARVDTLLYDSYNQKDLRKVLFYKAASLTGHVFKGDYAGRNTANLFNGLATDEVMLIKAEAAIRKESVEEGIRLLNSLLETRWEANSYVPFATGLPKLDALKVVLKERRKQLAFRGGLRWSDIRRLSLEPEHAVELKRKIAGHIYILGPHDKRLAFLIPEMVTDFGNVEQNER